MKSLPVNGSTTRWLFPESAEQWPLGNWRVPYWQSAYRSFWRTSCRSVHNPMNRAPMTRLLDTAFPNLSSVWKECILPDSLLSREKHPRLVASCRTWLTTLVLRLRADLYGLGFFAALNICGFILENLCQEASFFRTSFVILFVLKVVQVFSPGVITL